MDWNNALTLLNSLDTVWGVTLLLWFLFWRGRNRRL